MGHEASTFIFIKTTAVGIAWMYKSQLDPVVYQNLPRFLRGIFGVSCHFHFQSRLGKNIDEPTFRVAALPILQVWRICICTPGITPCIIA